MYFQPLTVSIVGGVGGGAFDELVEVLEGGLSRSRDRKGNDEVGHCEMEPAMMSQSRVGETQLYPLGPVMKSGKPMTSGEGRLTKTIP